VSTVFKYIEDTVPLTLFAVSDKPIGTNVERGIWLVLKGNQLMLTVGEVGGGRIELGYTGTNLGKNTWIGLVLTWNGYQSTTMTPADAIQAYTLGLVDRESSVVTDLVWDSVQVTNSPSLLSIEGAHLVGAGALVGTWGNDERQVFRGSIASHVATTLLAGAPLPSYDELALMLRDPLQWVQSYKLRAEAHWRSPASGSNNSTDSFPTINENGTRIWLMGDGVNPTDSTDHDDSTTVYNQADSSGLIGALQLSAFGANNMDLIDSPPGTFEDPLLGPKVWFGLDQMSTANLGYHPDYPLKQFLAFDENTTGSIMYKTTSDEYVNIFERSSGIPGGEVTIVASGGYDADTVTQNFYLSVRVGGVEITRVNVIADGTGEYGAPGIQLSTNSGPAENLLPWDDEDVFKLYTTLPMV
jgi:hypothetical protein